MGVEELTFSRSEEIIKNQDQEQEWEKGLKRDKIRVSKGRQEWLAVVEAIVIARSVKLNVERTTQRKFRLCTPLRLDGDAWWNTPHDTYFESAQFVSAEAQAQARHFGLFSWEDCGRATVPAEKSILNSTYLRPCRRSQKVVSLLSVTHTL